jgi:hypothetical protein
LKALSFERRQLIDVQKNWALLLELEAEGLIPSLDTETARRIILILDLSDSMGEGTIIPSVAQILHVIFNTLDTVDFQVYIMGEESAMAINRRSHELSKLLLNSFQENNRTGSFISSTLAAIENEPSGEKTSGKTPILVITDGEVWDHQACLDFLQAQDQFNIDFILFNSTTIEKRIFNALKHSMKASTFYTPDAASDFCSDYMRSHLADDKKEIIHQITIKILDLKKCYCAVDLSKEVKKIETAWEIATWQPAMQIDGNIIFRRFLFLPQRIDEVQAEIKPDPGTAISISAPVVRCAMNLSDIISGSREHDHFIEIVDGCNKWSWEEKAIEQLLDSIESEMPISESLFKIKCPSCTRTNQPNQWIKQSKTTTKCRNCTQLLLHRTKRLSSDALLPSHTLIFLELHRLLNGAFEMVEEPLATLPISGFRVDEDKNIHFNSPITIHSLTVGNHANCALEECERRDGRCSRETTCMFYWKQPDPELHKWQSFDIIEPVVQSAFPKTYYLFINISFAG